MMKPVKNTKKKPKKGKEGQNKSKSKASKTVLISESYSKPRRTSCDWEAGPTDEDFLHPRKEKGGKGRKEGVDKAKIRLSLTHSVPRPQMLSKVKTEMPLEHESPSRLDR